MASFDEVVAAFAWAERMRGKFGHVIPELTRELGMELWPSYRALEIMLVDYVKIKRGIDLSSEP